MISYSNIFNDKYKLFSSVCIVGGGPIGISLALELGEAGIDVLLLESGGLKTDITTQSLGSGFVNTEKHYPLQKYHLRQLGGKSTVWGGRCVPFDEVDFKRRHHVPYSGWPISKNDLLPYYDRAHFYLNVGENKYQGSEVFGSQNRPMISGFADKDFDLDSLERFSLPVNFNTQYHGQLKRSNNIHVVLNATVTKIELNEDATGVKNVLAKTNGGNSIIIESKHVILANGALDATRLLLASNDKHHKGLGNYSGYLGKFYMDHLYGTIGTIKMTVPNDKTFFDYEKDNEGVYCRKRFRLSKLAQEKYELLNFIAFTNHNYLPSIENPAHKSGALSIKYIANRVINNISYDFENNFGFNYTGINNPLQHVKNMLFDVPDVLKYSKKFLLGRIPGKRKLPGIFIESDLNQYPLFYQSEQVPNINSKICLSGEVDRHGLPKLDVRWNYDEQDIDSIIRTYRIMDDSLRRNQVGYIEYDKINIRSEIIDKIVVGNHPSGTTRMSESEHAGVVDKDCKVFGVSNLYVAGSSVFVTSSHANPTLTALALAMRVADKIKTSFENKERINIAI